MPNDPEASPRLPRARLRLRHVAGIIAAVLAFPIVVWLVWGWIERARLGRALDALEASKEPLDIAEFDARPKTPEQREASHLYAAAYKAAGDRTITTLQTTELARAIEDLCSASAVPTQRATTARTLRAFEEPYVHAFELLDRATALDASGWDEADRPSPGSSLDLQMINLTRANGVRIARLACTGEGEDAATALLATLRLRRVVNRSLMVFPPETAHSLHVMLTFGGATPRLLERIENEYASAGDPRFLENRMLRNRAFWLSWMLPGVFSEAPPQLEPGRMTPVEVIARRLVVPLRNHRIVAELREFDEAATVAGQPWPGKLDAVRQFADDHQRSRTSGRMGMLDALTQPFGSHAAANLAAGDVERAAETLARTRASIGAVAVARYRADHPGAMPASLQQLIPAYLRAPLIDPYTGAELKYLIDGMAYKVYSVGINRKDDGGTWELHSDLQRARRGNPLDVGIAVTPPRSAN